MQSNDPQTNTPVESAPNLQESQPNGVESEATMASDNGQPESAVVPETNGQLAAEPAKDNVVSNEVSPESANGSAPVETAAPSDNGSIEPTNTTNPVEVVTPVEKPLEAGIVSSVATVAQTQPVPTSAKPSAPKTVYYRYNRVKAELIGEVQIGKTLYKRMKAYPETGGSVVYDVHPDEFATLSIIK